PSGATASDAVVLLRARDVRPKRLQPGEAGRVVATFAVQYVGLVEVHARTVDRVLDSEAVTDDVDDDLQHRAPQPQRAGATDDEMRAAAAQHDRRAHGRRQPLARRRLPGDVELADHVVHVDAGAWHHDAGAGAGGRS